MRLVSISSRIERWEAESMGIWIMRTKGDVKFIFYPKKTKKEKTHSFNMFPKTLHIKRRATPISPSLPSHQPTRRRTLHNITSTRRNPIHSRNTHRCTQTHRRISRRIPRLTKEIIHKRLTRRRLRRRPSPHTTRPPARISIRNAAESVDAVGMMVVVLVSMRVAFA